MDDTTKEAYRIVLNDILNNGCEMFAGIYDAKHGSAKYMYGISAVMEYIAYSICDKQGDDFSNLFIKNMIASEQGQGCYMIPKGSVSGISYGDHYWYVAYGQPWLFGGASNAGAWCGLAAASSYDAWTVSNADLSARLAYYGNINKVSSSRLAELAA